MPEPMSRRGFLAKSAVAAAAGVAATAAAAGGLTTVGGLLTASPAGAASAGASGGSSAPAPAAVAPAAIGVSAATVASAPAATDLTPLGTDVIAHVRDASTGEVSIMAGEREVVLHDRALVARLLNGARQAGQGA